MCYLVGLPGFGVCHCSVTLSRTHSAILTKHLQCEAAGDTNWNSSRSLFSQGSCPSETPVTCADGPRQPLFLGALAPGDTWLQSSKSDTAPHGGARFQEPLGLFTLFISGRGDPILPCWLGRVPAGW